MFLVAVSDKEGLGWTCSDLVRMIYPCGRIKKVYSACVGESGVFREGQRGKMKNLLETSLWPLVPKSSPPASG